MFEAYSKGIDVAANSALTFTNNVLFGRCTDIALSGTGTVVLNKPGVYEIVLDGVALAGEAGELQIQTMRNCMVLPQAEITVTGATTATGIPFSVRTFVEGPSCCCKRNGNIPVTVQFMNTGVAFTGDVHVTADKEK